MVHNLHNIYMHIYIYKYICNKRDYACMWVGIIGHIDIDKNSPKGTAIEVPVIPPPNSALDRAFSWLFCLANRGGPVTWLTQKRP